MANFKIPEAFTWQAEPAADLTTSLNRLVQMQTGGTVILGASGSKVLGPIIEVPLAATSPYGPASIQVGGVAKMVASAAINAGVRVQCAASGKIEAGSTNPVGVTLERATGDGSVIAVLMNV